MSKLKEMKKSGESSDKLGTVYFVLAGLAGLLLLAVIYSLFFSSGPSANTSSLEEGGHTKGNPDATVRIVEFSDFQCPACGSAYGTVKRIFSEYSDRISFTYRHFPLTSIHPFAFKASEASECAADQGKFWEMHDKMFENQSALKVSDLKGYASSIGLDSVAFDSCLDSGKYASKVSSHITYGNSLGVNSTPTFYINGQKYSNLTYDQFKAVIGGKLS